MSRPGWAVAGQEKDRRPVKSYSGSVWNRTSATPPPSEPGSQAATKASESFISGFTQSGRPDRKIDTTGMPLSLKASSFVVSNPFGTKSIVRTSPIPSAYGFSPYTAITTSASTSDSPVGSKTSVPPPGNKASSIPSRMDSPFWKWPLS